MEGETMKKDKTKRRPRSRLPKALKIIVEKHRDGFVAYPLGLKGVVVGEGNTYKKAMADVKSAIRFHIDTFGKQAVELESPVLEAFVDEAEVPG
jgi:predicted RNase H-like HicB family nuclease